jgi:hypothetical protein
VRRDETNNLHNKGSGCEGWNHSRNFASLDQGQENQASEANARRCKGEAYLDSSGLDPTSRYERENLLEGARTPKKEETLKEAGRAGA